MQYRQLGDTDLIVSVLGYGASPLGNVFGTVDTEAGIAAVRTALDLGINFLDVSPYYGDTLAEQVLGRALTGIRREDYVLATKVGRYGVDDFDFSADRVRRSVQQSMRRLGVEHLDLIQCHDIEFVEVAQIEQETLPALIDLREQGVVRHVGITGYPLRIMTELANRTDIDTVLTYCRLTLVDQSLVSWLPTLHAAGVGVINASPLAMGLLSDRGAPAWHPAPELLRSAAADAVRFCRQQGADIAQLALQFSVQVPGPATTVVGSADAEKMTRNVAWAEQPIDQELLAAVLALLSPVRDTTWSSGLPQNEDTAVA